MNKDAVFPQLKVSALILREIVKKRFVWVDLRDVWPSISIEFPREVSDGDRWNKHGLNKVAYLCDQVPEEVDYSRIRSRTCGVIHRVKFVGDPVKLPERGDWKLDDDYFIQWVQDGERPYDTNEFLIHVDPPVITDEELDRFCCTWQRAKELGRIK